MHIEKLFYLKNDISLELSGITILSFFKNSSISSLTFLITYNCCLLKYFQAFSAIKHLTIFLGLKRFNLRHIQRNFFQIKSFEFYSFFLTLNSH